MIVEYNRMSRYIFCLWNYIQLMLLFVCLVKVMRGTLEPFDPSASYVHPSARPHSGKRSKLSIREASEFTLNDETPESDEDEDADEVKEENKVKEEEDEKNRIVNAILSTPEGKIWLTQRNHWDQRKKVIIVKGGKVVNFVF